LFQWLIGFSAGDVTFGAGSLEKVLEVWFGSDTTAIQTAINATPTKGTIKFANGSYSLGTITLKPDITYEGNTDREFNTSHSILKYNATSGDFLTLYNAGATQLGVTIKNLIIDGNATTGTIVKLGTHRSKIIDSVIKNGGTGSKGIYFTNGGSDTAVENGLWRTSIKNVGTGVYSDGNATDGFIVDSLIYSCSSDGINLQQAFGWHVSGNHLYAVTNSAVKINGGYFRVVNNYIEGSHSAGIDLTLTTSFNSGVVSGNEINNTANSSKGIKAQATTTSEINCLGNTLFATSSPSGTTGISIEGSNQIYGFLQFNVIKNFTTPISSAWTDSTSSQNITGNRLELSASIVRLKTLSGVAIDFMTGSGAPEGVITANPGSLYTNYSAGTLYIKTAGAGNTGWTLK
jgi:hypothetical protein